MRAKARPASAGHAAGPRCRGRRPPRGGRRRSPAGTPARRRPRRSPARSRMTSRMSGPRHGSGVAPALCQPMRQPGPPSRAVDAAVRPIGGGRLAEARSSSGYGSSASTRSGRRVGGEEHLGARRAAPARPSATAAARNVRYAGEVVPALDADGRARPASAAASADPGLVLADAEPGVVRGQDEADDGADAGRRPARRRRPR